MLISLFSSKSHADSAEVLDRSLFDDHADGTSKGAVRRRNNIKKALIEIFMSVLHDDCTAHMRERSVLELGWPSSQTGGEVEMDVAIRHFSVPDAVEREIQARGQIKGGKGTTVHMIVDNRPYGVWTPEPCPTVREKIAQVGHNAGHVIVVLLAVDYCLSALNPSVVCFFL